jgi:glycosyltransferase involved in cell wall biosynthesis
MSLVKQTLKEIEIIVVDDGSTDNTLQAIKEFAKYDKRIIAISQPNLRQGAARNNGTRLAKGEYIGFVDSDDWVDEEYYEKLYIAAKKYNSDIALATNVRVGNGKTKNRLDIQKEEVVTTLQDKFDINNQWKNECPTNKIYRISMLKNNNITWPEGVYCEDKMFTTQAVYYANSVVTVPDVHYYYYRRPDSTVNNDNDKFYVVISDNNGRSWEEQKKFTWTNDGKGDFDYNAIPVDGKTYSFFASEAGNEGIIAFYSRELQEVKDSTADFYEIADDYFLFSVKVIKANKKRIVLQVDYVGAGQPFTQGAEYTLYRTPDSEEGAQ